MNCIGNYLIQTCKKCNNIEECKSAVRAIMKIKPNIDQKELELAEMLLDVMVNGKQLTCSDFGSDQWIEYNTTTHRFEYEDHVSIGCTILDVLRFYKEPFQSWSRNTKWYYKE